MLRHAGCFISSRDSSERSHAASKAEESLFVIIFYLYLSSAITEGTHIALECFLNFVLKGDRVSCFSDDPSALHPDLSCGFGQKPKAVVGRRKTKSLDPVLELTSLLIADWMVLRAGRIYAWGTGCHNDEAVGIAKTGQTGWLTAVMYTETVQGVFSTYSVPASPLGLHKEEWRQESLLDNDEAFQAGQPKEEQSRWNLCLTSVVLIWDLSRRAPESKQSIVLLW
ncbi:hypothetical protein BKA67DRAFT_568009 [Truncatella angustata]|uniref:Uncharacterized protein n=1 Tax=Truncatella angustata TaxID=152316 RepID=A0A9P8UIR7_9PEZI|nr:uncharacterized protein BKA67DRAFT_568009 [Truncatella angustata]KAH6652929.1 hypothetical protein BKA67DRAFT_568009 [Truncatella angustata]